MGWVFNVGAWLYFDWFNFDGGINGEIICLVVCDDEQKVEQILCNVCDMVKIDNFVVVFIVVGIVNVEVFMCSGVLVEVNLLLVGFVIGVFSMIGDLLVFFIKVSYQ